MSRASLRAVVGMVCALLLAGCAAEADGQPARSADVADVDQMFVAVEMEYLDAVTELEAGTHVLGLDNQGRAMHDLTIDRGIGTVASALPGEQDAGEVTLEAGSYTVYCAVPGHRQAGMELDLVVG